MKKDIRLSPKHGLNPSIEVCYFCGKDKNSIAMLGLLPKDEKAPTRACYNREPCDECAEYMKDGVIILSADSAKTVNPNIPYRTGGFAVVKEDVVKRIIKDAAILSRVLEVRMMFLDSEAWKAIGLPNIEDIPTTVN